LESGIRVLEVDFPHVTTYKQSRINDLVHQGLLPARPIQFCGVDLTSPDDLARFELALKTTVDQRASFILMEGLTYYLDRASLDRLFDIFRKHQSTGSSVAFDYWPRELGDKPICTRLREYFETHLGQAPHDYNFLDEGYVRSRRGYAVAELSNVVAEETRILGTQILQTGEILCEHYAILTKTHTED
jgi:O-methyltransferase involved in polyketide biosynthesis